MSAATNINNGNDVDATSQCHPTYKLLLIGGDADADDGGNHDDKHHMPMLLNNKLNNTS
jgi:hypothetical protein